mmetsp:Transcript_4468/g.10904  ORF Transcript_4468/g.10904 Transcript_4468/m.10904 type:complete len:239 (+) Transcript_4468:939-1655(+)
MSCARSAISWLFAESSMSPRAMVPASAAILPGSKLVTVSLPSRFVATPMPNRVFIGLCMIIRSLRHSIRWLASHALVAPPNPRPESVPSKYSSPRGGSPPSPLPRASLETRPVESGCTWPRGSEPRRKAVGTVVSKRNDALLGMRTRKERPLNSTTRKASPARSPSGIWMSALPQWCFRRLDEPIEPVAAIEQLLTTAPPLSPGTLTNGSPRSAPAHTVEQHAASSSLEWAARYLVAG